MKGVSGQAPLLEPHKPVTALLNLQVNKMNAKDGTRMQCRKTHTGNLYRSQFTAQQSCCRIPWKRWVNAMFFVFFLCLHFESCFHTPTISHLYLWQKHPPHRHPSESKTCKPLHLTVTQVKQTFPLDSQLLLCSKQAFWLSGMSSSSRMALLFTSGVINVKYDSTSERRNCLKYCSIYETLLYFTREKRKRSLDCLYFIDDGTETMALYMPLYKLSMHLCKI